MKCLYRAVIGTATLATLLGSVALNNVDIDYSRMPERPAVMEEQLNAAGVSLREAVANAENALKGRAASAAFDATRNAFTVDIYAAGQRHRAIVDAGTGDVLSHEALPWLPGEPTDGEIITTDSGLQYIDIVVGDGPAPDGPTAVVKVHYTGRLVDGRKFDSSVDRGEPATFPLNRVIPGWTEGVGSMRVGGKRKLLVPANLAYGAREIRDPQTGELVIPADAFLIFDVELIEIVR